MSPCSQTKRLANQNWPLYEKTSSGLCCYSIRVDSSAAAANIIVEAQNKPDYVKHSKFFEIPGNRILFYLYFEP